MRRYCISVCVHREGSKTDKLQREPYRNSKSYAMSSKETTIVLLLLLCRSSLQKLVLLVVFVFLHELVDGFELPRPSRVVQKGPEIESVVVGAVALRVVARCQRAHLVPVDRVIEKEALDLGGHLAVGELGAGRLRIGTPIVVAVAVVARPLEDEPPVHAYRAAPSQLAKPTEPSQLVIGHSHFLFVQLGVLGVLAVRRFRVRAQLGRGWRPGDFLEHGAGPAPVPLGGPEEHPFQVALGNRTDGVQVGRRAIILRHVAAQALVDVGGSQDQQEPPSDDLAGRPARPRQQLRKQIGRDHAEAGLDVLEGQVLGEGPAPYQKPGGLVGGQGKDLNDGAHHQIDRNGQVVASDGLAEAFRAVGRVLRRVFRSHKYGVQNVGGDFLRRGGHPVVPIPSAAVPVSTDVPQVVQDLFVRPRLLADQVAHGHDDGRHGAAVGAAAQWQQVARGAAPPQVVPQPAGRAQTALFLGRRPLQFDGLRHGGICGRRQEHPCLGNLHHDAAPVGRWRLFLLLDLVGKGGLLRPEGPDLVQIDRRRDNHHVCQAKLRRLRQDPAVADDDRTPVVVDPPAVATPLVRIQIDPTALGGGRHHQLQPLVELAELVVGPAPVADDLDALQRQLDVGRVGHPELLAGLAPDGHAVVRSERARRSTNGDPRGVVLDATGLQLVPHPHREGKDRRRCIPDGGLHRILVGREIAGLAVVPVVAQGGLGTDPKNLAVVAQDAAVVPAAIVAEDRHPEIADHSHRGIGFRQQGHQGLPGMIDGVLLQEVVLAAVPADLQLGS
mmetsp:Transcript_109783/g.224351  ORF Transcript_109783/g.224351 Transcript_109783/m.224351 type:complete len:780 (+) Transcript_109783:322-2661(+)